MRCWRNRPKNQSSWTRQSSAEEGRDGSVVPRGGSAKYKMRNSLAICSSVGKDAHYSSAETDRNAVAYHSPGSAEPRSGQRHPGISWYRTTAVEWVTYHQLGAAAETAIARSQTREISATCALVAPLQGACLWCAATQGAPHARRPWALVWNRLAVLSKEPPWRTG